MLPTGDVVRGTSWTRWLRHTLCQARAIAACATALGLSSCTLIGYENRESTPQIVDGGVVAVVPSDGRDEPTRDGSVAASFDGGIARVDAATDDHGDEDASLVDASDSGPFPVPMPAADASAAPPPAVDAGVNPPIPGCLGTPALGLCWHLGAAGLSCDEACDTSYGGFDSRTVSETGKPGEGGSLANCQTVLVALGITTAPLATYRPDGLGLGCHLFTSGATYWLDQRQGPFDSGDSLYDVRRACACVH